MGRAWLGIVALLAGCAARPREVNFAMWAGDEARNRYFETVVRPHLQTRHGLTLRIVPYGHTSEVVSKLITEKGAGKTTGGSIDVVWINGENFRAAKNAGVLWGPIVMPRLYPAAAYEKDFGTPIEGLETPWQSAQFVMAWDTARFAEPTPASPPCAKRSPTSGSAARPTRPLSPNSTACLPTTKSTSP
jgi:putative spermidine/putrescine transport system substrate-binding protein